MKTINLGNRHAQHSFAQIPSVNTSRSLFNRSHAVKDTFDFDYLVPIMVEEIIPGDTINLNVKSFARLATQAVPILDNMYCDYFFFFVPNRLVWTNWEKFCGAQTNPGDTTEYSIPIVTPNNTTENIVNSIFDHMGVPIGIANLELNALPFRAYNLIWNTWFRSEDLQNSITVDTDDGPDTASNYVLRKRCKKHDYFTACLPWPQKGDAVTLPFGSTAPVVTTGDTITLDMGANVNQTLQVTTGDILTANGPGTVQNVLFGNSTGLEADLATATAVTINQLRQALMMQSLLELDARGGTRYVEILKSHYNVVSPDFRLQRPEFLSGGTVQIMQHPVAQTSKTDSTDYLAKLGAFSTATNLDNSIGFSKSFVEHGYVIGLVQARADITYQQGLHKMWSRQTREDFFWPKLQELGEQAVLKREIYTQGDANDDEVFGYIPRYDEYRFAPSQIRGQFRSQYTTPLDIWHLAEEFGSEPSLNSTFIESNTPIERALLVAGTYPHILIDLWFDMKHARPMMTYGVPATLGRF